MGREGTVPMPGFQMLLYPATDLRANTSSYRRFTEGYPLTAETMHWFIDHYLPALEQRHDWRASPLCAPTLSGAAPAFVSTAGHDPLVDEGVAFAQRLDREGVHVTHLHVADQMHGYGALRSGGRPDAAPGGSGAPGALEHGASVPPETPRKPARGGADGVRSGRFSRQRPGFGPCAPK